MISGINSLLSEINFLQPFIHYFLHLVFPVFIAFFFFNKPAGNWKKAYLVLLLTMLVDLDHLLATPIFDADRCSIGFHLLHSYWAIAGYGLLLAFRKTRIAATGLLFHMLTDYLDCNLMN